MQHLVQRYIRSVLITENYHAYGVAHKDNVDATLIEQTCGRIIVRRQRGNLLTALLHLTKILHCAWSQDQLPISERKPRQKRALLCRFFHLSIYQFSAKRTA